MHIDNIRHKMIDAERLLVSKFPEPVKTNYQQGWNDALQSVYDEEPGLVFIKDGDADDSA